MICDFEKERERERERKKKDEYCESGRQSLANNTHF